MKKNLSNIIKDFLEEVAIFAVKKPYIVFISTFVLLVLAAFAAVNVQMEMGMDLYLDEDSKTLQDWSSLKTDFSKGNAVFILIETDDSFDLYEPENARLISDLYQNIYGAVPDASLVTSFAHPIKAGLGKGKIPDTKEDVIRSVELTQEEHRSNEKVIYNLHPGAQNMPLEENNMAVIQVQYGNINLPDNVSGRLGGFVPPDENEYIRDLIQKEIDDTPISQNANVTITGSPVFESVAFGLMLPEILLLFSVAFAVIVITLFLLTRSTLQKWFHISFPLITVLAAVFIMLGLMGLFGFNFNAIMLGVMPVALGLGIDYALQIQSRYLSERNKGKNILEAAKISARNDGYALLIAFTTTIVGLLSLVVALVPPVRQFGLTAAFSVFASMVLSLTLLISLVTFFDAQKSSVIKNNNARKKFYGLEKYFFNISEYVNKNSSAFIIIFLLIFAFGFFAYLNVETQTDMLDYWPQIQERQDIRDLQNLVAAPNILYVVSQKPNIHFDYNALKKISRFEHALESNELIVTPISPVRAVEMTSQEETIAEINESVLFDRLAVRVGVDRPPVASQPYENHPNQFITQIYVSDLSGVQEREVIDFIDSVGSVELEGMDFYVSGNVVVNRNVIENVTVGLTRTTLVSFIMGLLVLTLLLWSFRDAFVLILGVSAGSVLFAAAGMFLFKIPWNPLTVTTASIILGIGIDYAVHIFERFKEEYGKGKKVKESISVAIANKTRPILASGVTTLFGFGVLAISDFPVLYEFGVAIVLAITGSLILSFFLLPALLTKIYGKNKAPKPYILS